MTAALLDSAAQTAEFTMGDYTLTVKHEATWPYAPKAAGGTPRYGGLIVQTGKDEFYIAGSGILVTFRPASADPAAVAGIGFMDYRHIRAREVGTWTPAQRRRGPSGPPSLAPLVAHMAFNGSSCTPIGDVVRDLLENAFRSWCCAYHWRGEGVRSIVVPLHRRDARLMPSSSVRRVAAVVLLVLASVGQSDTIQTNVPALKNVYAHDFRIGCWLFVQACRLSNRSGGARTVGRGIPNGGYLIKYHMNSMSPGNNMKPQYTVQHRAAPRHGRRQRLRRRRIPSTPIRSSSSTAISSPS